MTVLIRTESLTRVFNGPEPVSAVDDCTFSVTAGEMIAVTGPSGSGKSTLLNCLGLLDRPSSGQYFLAGREATGMSERQRAALRARLIGFVFQDYNLLWGRTAIDNVAMGPIYQRMRSDRRTSLAEISLEAVGLTHRRKALVETLSGGEKQRVAIARAIASSPRLLLCDEPTGNLDSATEEAVLDALDRLNTEGQTIIVVTHAPDVAARATRQFDMRDGRLSEIS